MASTSRPRHTQAASSQVPIAQIGVPMAAMPASARRHAAAVPTTTPPALAAAAVHSDMRSLSSFRRGGWKRTETKVPHAKVDSGLRAHQDAWGGPVAHAQRTTRHQANAQTTTRQPAGQTDEEHVITARTPAVKEIIDRHAATQRTKIVREGVEDTAAATAVPSLQPSSSAQSLISPRHKKLQLSAADSASMFTNSHHFDAMSVPAAPRPLNVPALLLPQQSTSRLLGGAGVLSPHASDLEEDDASPPFSSRASLVNLHAAHSLTLAPSASAGALPFGMSPSDSYSHLHVSRTTQGHVQSSPSMPRFGVHASDSTAGLRPSASGVQLSSHASVSDLAAAYPAEHTVDNSSLIATYLRAMIRERGYRYRARAKGEIIQGESSEEEDQPMRRRRRKAPPQSEQKDDAPPLAQTARTSSEPSASILPASKQPRTSRHAYPRPDWDRKGFESIAAQLPFELLFGLEDTATRLKRKKREHRIEEERVRRERFAQSEMKDDEQVQHARGGGTNANTDEETATAPSRALSRAEGRDGPSSSRQPSNVIVPADLIGVSTAALTQAARTTDPLNPHPRPSLLTAAARVLLRKELHPPTVDANQVIVSPSGSRALSKAPVALVTTSKKGLHDLVAAKTTLEDDATLLEQHEPNGGKFFDARRARLTFLEHSSRAYTTPAQPGRSGAHGSHNVHTHAMQQQGTKRDLKANMESWLRARNRRPQRTLKEEDRLRAREMFDMLLLAAGNPHANSASGEADKRIAERRDPSAVSIELEAMRRALHNLGMEVSTEDLAFRLHKLSEYHATSRANAAAGISNKASSKSLRGAVAAPQHALHLTFNDFLSVFEHISQWEELASFKKLKEQRERDESNKLAARRHRRAASEVESPSRSPRKRMDDRTDEEPTPALALSVESPSGGTRRLTTSQSRSPKRAPPSPRLGPSASASSIGISTEEKTPSPRQVELPFTLWVPAAHRNARINELVHIYGQPNLVGVGVGFEDPDLPSPTNKDSPRRGGAIKKSTSKVALAKRAAGQQRVRLAADKDSDLSSSSSSSSESEEDFVMVEAPVNIVRTLVDELNLGKLILPPVSSATAASPNTPSRKPSLAGHGRRPSLSHARRPSLLLSPPTPKQAAGGAYWGSQQVQRAGHYKNLSLSSRHEPLTPSALVTPGLSGISAPSPRPMSRGGANTSVSARRTTFVPPLRVGAILEATTPGNDTEPLSAFALDSATTDEVDPPSTRRSHSVREITSAQLASADRTAREVAELVRQVQANLAGPVLDTVEDEAEDEDEASQADDVVVDEAPIQDEVSEESKPSLSPLMIPRPVGPSIQTKPAATRRTRSIATSALVAPVAVKPLELAIATGPARPVDRSRAAEDKVLLEVMSLTDPMVKAAKSGAWEDVLMLIQTSASENNVRARTAYVNRRDKNGSTAISHCVWPGHFKVLEVLLFHGADPNVQNNRLNTALHLATEKGHRSLVRLLIEMGASIELKNWQAKTCLDVIPVEDLDVATTQPTVTVVPAGSTPSTDPTPAALQGALRTHAANEASDSLRSFVLECAADAKRKRDQEKSDASSGLLSSAAPSVGVTAASGRFNFAEFSLRRDAANAATLAAASAAAASLSLLGPDGKPAIDLWELTAADRRSAGIRGNFMGAANLQHGGQEQARTLTGQLLLHTRESAQGIAANSNAMSSYRSNFARQHDPAAVALRARIVSGLVREELAHSSLHALWLRTQQTVAGRATVITEPEHLLAHAGGRMDQLRATMHHQQHSQPAAQPSQPHSTQE